MKQKIIILLVFIIAVIIFIPKETQELRIRVIANSDSTYDQRMKMNVVNILKKEISKFDQDNIINEVINNIDILNDKISNSLKGTSYTIGVDKVRFPTKEIDGQVIPGGKFKTLLVVINEGKGKNWWSLLYPKYHNLSFEDVETNDVEYKFYFWEELKKSISGK